VFKNKKSPKLSASILSAIILSSSLPMLTISSSAQASTCRLTANTGALDSAVERYCNTRANVDAPDPNAEKGDPGWIPYFFENPDECDLGISFPDLIPDFNLDISKINSCDILKAVSSNAVEQVNEKFSEIESDVNAATGGDVDIDVDLDDEVNNRINDN
jgi:hypothetical protein